MDLDAYYMFIDLFRNERSVSNIEQDGVLLRQFCDKDFDNLCRFLLYNKFFGERSDDVEANLRSKIDCGSSCVLAFFDGEIAGMGWISYPPKNKWPHFARFPGLPDNIALIHTDFVAPKFRGKKIHKKIISERKRIVISGGYQGVVSFVGVKNLASLNSYMKISQRYRLVYNVIIDLPLIENISFFICKRKELWSDCFSG